MKKTLLSILIAFCGLLCQSVATAQITIYPNTTDFETESLCGTSCSGSCNPVGVWRNADQWGFAQAGTDWLVEDGPTPSTATGPDIDHTVGTATGKYMYVETSGCNNITAYLISDIFDFSALTAPKIKFWYHMYGATMGTMHLDVDTTGLGDYVLDVTTAWTDNVNAWQEKQIDLSAYAGRPSVRLRIRGLTGTSFTSDMAVDDIMVYEPAPYDILGLNVSNPNSGCGLGIENLCMKFINYGTSAIAAGDSIQFTATVDGGAPFMETYILSSSIPSGDTAIYCFVQTTDLTTIGSHTINISAHHVSDALTGNDAVSVTVTSIPLYSTFPVTDDFEGGQNGWVINNGTSGTWAFGTPAKTTIIGAASGVNAFVTGGLGTGFYNDLDNSYVQGACYDFSTVCDPTIKLKVWWNAEFSWDGANVMTSIDGGNSWQLVGNFGNPNNWYTDNTIVGNPGGSQEGWSGRAATTDGSNGWVTAIHKLTGVAGQSQVLMKISFGTDGSVTDDGFAFDDVTIYDGVLLEGPTALCIGNSGTLTTSGDGTGTYVWNTAETTNSISVDSMATYSVTYTSGACVNSDSIFVTVIDNIANNFANAGPDLAICDTTASFDAGMMSNINWLWSNGATTATTSLNGAQSTVMHLTGTSTLVGCPGVSTDSAVVDIFGLNSVNLNDTANCGPAILDAGSGQTNYLWSNGDNAQTTEMNSTGMLAILVTDANGCTASDTADITIYSIPVVSFGTDQSICKDGSAILDAGAGFVGYLWNTSEVTQSILVDGSILSIGNHIYHIMVTDTNGCTNADTIGIFVNGLPTVSLGTNQTICNNATTTLDPGAGFAGYLWNNSAISQTILVDGNLLGAGTYNYSVLVTDGNTCSNSDTVTVTVINCSGIEENAGVSLLIYPNPTTALVYIHINTTVDNEIRNSILNELGQVVYTEAAKTINAGEQTMSLDVSNLRAGLYFINTQVGNQKIVSRIVVE